MPRPAFGTERVGEPLPPAPLRAFHAAPLQEGMVHRTPTPPPPCKWAGTNDTPNDHGGGCRFGRFIPPKRRVPCPTLSDSWPDPDRPHRGDAGGG